MSEIEIFLLGRKYLLSNNIVYTIRDRESDEDYDPDEEWTFRAWCGPEAPQAIQNAYKALKTGAQQPVQDVMSTNTTNTTNTTKEFPTLYGESSHGKRKVWSIRVETRTTSSGHHGVIVNEHGYEDGKKVVNERVVEKGKNIGRSNETTPFQQAVGEAQSAWNKKRDAGYKPEGSEDLGAPAVGIADTGSLQVAKDSAAAAAAAPPLPMLAQDFNKRGKSIMFPCYVQAKLDGVRCVAVAGTQTLFSRNGKAFPHLEHIRTELAALPTGTILDGELYSDALTFQEIVGLVKKETLRGDDAEKLKKIYLCVYDIIVTGKTNTERNALLENLFAADEHISCGARDQSIAELRSARDMFRYMRMLPTKICKNREEVKSYHADFVAAGYEGLMLRNCAGMYRVGVRSTDLQKYKEFEDAEYKVVGYKEGDGLEKGCVIWMCETPKGQVFAVRPRGTHEARAALMKEAARFVGQQLTVRFQELTTDGIPRFPVGLAFRDYE